MAVVRAANIMYEVVDGRAVLVDPKGAELLTLNEVGTLVWEALDGGSDARALATQLLPRFTGVTADELEADITSFIAELRDADLVVEA